MADLDQPTPPARPIRLLITSIGSLVGQNILDVLDYPAFNRRAWVHLIGTNSVGASANNFRCDRCHLVPETASPEFLPRMATLLREETPDILLCGRDEDTATMRDLLRQQPACHARIPHGSVESLLVALDKGRSWRFCQQHGLPFAETLIPRQDPSAGEFEAFAARVGYPLVGKPARGFASKGVFFVRNPAEAVAVARLGPYVFQEYLGDPATLSGYFQSLEAAPPLFAHAPNVFHHSCHTFIYPDGHLDQIFVSRNAHNAGVTVGFERVWDDALATLTTDFARALHAEGGMGPMTVQFRRDRRGNWKAMEINLRTNGNTFPRFLMGQDELGIIVNTLFPDADFPVYAGSVNDRDHLACKVLRVETITRAAVARLQADGVFPPDGEGGPAAPRSDPAAA